MVEWQQLISGGLCPDNEVPHNVESVMSVICQDEWMDDCEALDDDEQDRNPGGIEEQPRQVQEVVLEVLNKNGVRDPEGHGENSDECHAVAKLG